MSTTSPPNLDSLTTSLLALLDTYNNLKAPTSSPTLTPPLAPKPPSHPSQPTEPQLQSR